MDSNNEPNNFELKEKTENVKPDQPNPPDQNIERIDGHTDPEEQTQKLPYPKSVFFIVSNEFCERFSFYGMRTILALYLKNQLKFSDTTATVIYHVFIMICYFFPLLGAIVADSWLGKFKTILYLSIVYALGNIVVSVTAVPDSLPPVAFTMIGLVLIAFGTGGIKPCVSAFGGDQFVLPRQEDQLQRFFSIFYFAINSGSFVSTFLTPILREVKCLDQDSCYPLAFGVPALLMVLAIIIYVSGKKFYKIKQPEGNVVVKVAKCMWYAATTKTQKKISHWLDKAQDKYEQEFIDDIKATLRVLVLYIPLPIFWALFDQQGSRWTFQATRMNGEIGSFKIQPDQMQVVNPILILAFIPLFESVVYPVFGKCNLLKRPLQRLTVGGLLAAVAFGISAVVETQLEPTYPILPKSGEGQLRIYNALPEKISINIPEIQFQDDLESMEVKGKLDIRVRKTRDVTLTYTRQNITSQEKILKIYENQATSYSIMENEILEINNEDIDKSDNGNPKIMVIYYGKKNIKVEFSERGSLDKLYTVELNSTVRHSNYSKISLVNEKYSILINDTVVKGDIEMKQGGVYVVLIRDKNEKIYEVKMITITQPNSVHILWLIPQYVVITAGEVMFSITGLEFSFTQAPVTMKSLLQAAWLLTVALGNLLVVIIAEAKIFDSQTYEFLLFATLMFIDMVIFALMAMRYKYVEHSNNEDSKEAEDDKNENHKG